MDRYAKLNSIDCSKLGTALLHHLDGASLFVIWFRAGEFALIWWLTQKSGSAAVLAIATVVGMLPQIVLGPFEIGRAHV